MEFDVSRSKGDVPQEQGEMQADTRLFTFGTPEVILRPRKPTDEDGLHFYPTPGLSVIKDTNSIWAASLVGSPSNALTPTLCGVRRKPFHDVSNERIDLGPLCSTSVLSHTPIHTDGPALPPSFL